MDHTERDRTVRFEVEIPMFGSEVHVGKLRERLKSLLALHFEDVKIKNVDS